MLIDVLKEIFARHLNKLKAEIELFQKEENIWHYEKGISNSAGNLCLHLAGNLNTYLGATFGNTAYVRNRDTEFSLKNIPRTQLLQSITATIAVVDNALQTLNREDLEKEYPILVFEQKTTVEYFLVHLAAHLAYHLGQINYCRRLLDIDKTI